MPETGSKPEAKHAKREGDTSNAESSETSAPKAVHGLEVHALSEREQLMRQWPTQNYEKRG